MTLGTELLEVVVPVEEEELSLVDEDLLVEVEPPDEVPFELPGLLFLDFVFSFRRWTLFFFSLRPILEPAAADFCGEKQVMKKL